MKDKAGVVSVEFWLFQHCNEPNKLYFPTLPRGGVYVSRVVLLGQVVGKTHHMSNCTTILSSGAACWDLQAEYEAEKNYLTTE